jgi:hypothetical protein
VLGAARLAVVTGRSPRLAVIASLGLYGVSLGYGFASFVFTSPLVLFALAGAERLVDALERERPLAGPAAEVALTTSLTFLGHALAFAFVVVLVVARVAVLALARAPRLGLTRGALQPVAVFALATAPVALLAAPSIVSFTRGGWTEVGVEQGAWSFEPFTARWAALAGHLLERGSAHHVSVMLGVLVWWALAQITSPLGPRPRGRGLELYALTACLVWAFGPMGTPSVWFVYPRFATLAAVLVLLLPRAAPIGGRAAALALGAVGLVAANAALNRDHVARMSAWAAPYDQIRAAIPPNQRVLPLSSDDGGLEHPALTGLHFYLMGDGARYVPFLFDNPGVPVHARRDVERPPAPFWREVARADVAALAPHYDYLVLRGAHLVGQAARLPALEEVTRARGWVVFRQRRALEPAR